MSEGVLYMLSGLISDVLSRGISAERGGNRLNGGAPYYNVYQTKDGKYLSIAAIEPWFWENLCRALGREDLLPHQDATGQQKTAVEEVLKDAFLTKTRDEWFEALKDANISVGKVYSLEEALCDPHAKERGMVLEIESPGIPEGTKKAEEEEAAQNREGQALIVNETCAVCGGLRYLGSGAWAQQQL